MENAKQIPFHDISIVFLRLSPQSTPLSVDGDVDAPLAVPPPHLVYCLCKFIVVLPLPG